MKFEGRPISAPKRLVNAMLTASLIFGLTACSSGEPNDTEGTANKAPNTGEIIELQAVWSTSALDKPVADIALSGGLSPILAVAYEGSGLELFDLDGERISEIAPYKIKQLAGGHEVEIGGARLSVFPGVNDRDELHAYVFGEGLVAPVEVPIGDGMTNLTGICSAPPSADSLIEGDILFQIGAWKRAENTVRTLFVESAGDELVFSNSSSSFDFEGTLNACGIFGELAQPLPDTTLDAALLAREGYYGLVTLSDSGALNAQDRNGATDRLLVNNGISVVMPESPTAIAALGKPLAGGYGGGLIVVTGDVGGGEKAVFIAADGLTGLSTNDADRPD